MGRRTFREFWNGLGWSGTGRGTLGDVWDGSRDTREDPGRVGVIRKRPGRDWGSAVRSGTGRGH